MTFLALPRARRSAWRAAARRFALAIGVVLAVFVALDRRVRRLARRRRSASTRRRAPTASSPRPSLHPPQIRIAKHAPAAQLAPGYIFTANFYDLNEPPIVGQSGPLILDRDAAAGLVPAGARKASSPPTSACRATTASRRSPGGRASSRTPARPKAAKTWSSTSTTSRSRRLKATGRLGADAARDRDRRRRRLGDGEQEHPEEPVASTAAPTTAR